MTRGFESVCTNDEARDYFKECGLSYKDIMEGEILALVLLLNRELKKSNKAGETSVHTMPNSMIFGNALISPSTNPMMSCGAAFSISTGMQLSSPSTSPIMMSSADSIRDGRLSISPCMNVRIASMSLSKKIDMKKDTDGSIRTCFLYLNSHYFTRREAISFNEDGFIGFAGWADGGNLNPLKRAFLAWCDQLKAERSDK